MPRADCRRGGNFVSPRRRSGNMPVAPERQPPLPLANRCRAIRPTSVNPTMEDRTEPLGPRPSGSEATRPMRGGCTTCTATSSSGVATGTTRACPAESILICQRGRARRTGTGHIRGSAGAERGWTRRYAAVPRFVCGMNHRAAPTTLASASSPSQQEDNGQRTTDV